MDHPCVHAEAVRSHRQKDSAVNISPAYIAGLFDGEGCVLARRRGSKISVEISITQVNPGVLHEIARALNLGRVYVSVWAGKKCGRLRLNSKHDVVSFIDMILPHTYVKTDQLLLMRELISTPCVERDHRSALVAAICELKH